MEPQSASRAIVDRYDNTIRIGKPRLFREFGHWVCIDAKGHEGKGPTPKDAWTGLIRDVWTNHYTHAKLTARWKQRIALWFYGRQVR